MELIIEALNAIADWFVMQGADMKYAPEIDPYETGPRMPFIHEARLGDLQVFIGEPTETFAVQAVAEVAILLRTGIPLPSEVVESLVEDARLRMPDEFEIEVSEGDDVEPGSSIWLVTSFDQRAIDEGAFGERLADLLRLSADAHDLRN